MINEAEFDRKALRRVLRLGDVLLKAALHYGTESDVFRGSLHTDLALEFLGCTDGFGGRLKNGAVGLEVGLWRCEEIGCLRFFSKLRKLELCVPEEFRVEPDFRTVLSVRLLTHRTAESKIARYGLLKHCVKRARKCLLSILCIVFSSERLL